MTRCFVIPTFDEATDIRMHEGQQKQTIFHVPLIRRLHRFCLCACLMILFSVAAAQDSTRLVIGFSGIANARRCDNAYHDVASVGSVTDIYVLLLPDGLRAGEVTDYSGVSDWVWPQNLEIEAGTVAYVDAECVHSQAIRDEFDFQYYVRRRQALDDSLWRATGALPAIGFRAPKYYFSFRAPTSLADSLVCFNVHWQHPLYGALTSEQPIYLKVINPCDADALHQAWTSQVCAAHDMGEDGLAIQLADSFMVQNWHPLEGLECALLAAMASQRWEDAIRYLDSCFEQNHTIGPWMAPTLPTVATAADSALYHETRQWLLDQLNQKR